MLLDKLAAAALGDPGFRAQPCQHSLENVQAVAQVLRVLTKEIWGADDLKVFDRFWPAASRSDLFGDEFEAERHRIGHFVTQTRNLIIATECDSKNR